jgi:hypothetical protein
MDADYIAPLAECKLNVDRVLAKVEDDHTNALLEYRHYTTKLEKMADEDDTQKLLRTHEKLLTAASRLTSATNNVYEEFNLFDDYRRKLIFEQTPKMFAAQRQLFHEVCQWASEQQLHALLTLASFYCFPTSCWRRWTALTSRRTLCHRPTTSSLSTSTCRPVLCLSLAAKRSAKAAQIWPSMLALLSWELRTANTLDTCARRAAPAWA